MAPDFLTTFVIFNTEHVLLPCREQLVLGIDESVVNGFIFYEGFFDFGELVLIILFIY